MPFIYKLIHNNEVVYVGQTKRANPLSRIFENAKDKYFNSYEFEKVEKNDLNKKEADLIALLKPKYNKNHNSDFIRSIGVNKNELCEIGIAIYNELRSRIAIQAETAHLSQSFADMMNYIKTKEENNQQSNN